MDIQDGASVIGTLTTIGRKTGAARSVELRFVFFRGCYYVSSSRVEGKHWCLNLLKDPGVRLNVGTLHFRGRARRVIEEDLRRAVLARRGSAADMSRVVFEITPD